MTTFAPRPRFPLLVKLFVGAGCVAAVVAPLVHLARRGNWTSPEWVAYFIGICLVAALGWFLVKEVSRQMQVIVSAQGVVLDLWRFEAEWPFLMLRETVVPWSSVRALRRAGLTLILDTPAGERSVNLFLFENPQQVEQFALDEWRTNGNGVGAAV